MSWTKYSTDFLSIPLNKLPWCRGSTTFAISRHLKCHQQKRSIATLIKGQEAAKKILSQVSKDLEVLKSVGIKPKVVVGVVGNDPASRIYLNRKKAAALKAGLGTSSSHVFTNSVTTNLRKKKSRNFICLLFCEVEFFDSDQTIKNNFNVKVNLC